MNPAHLKRGLVGAAVALALAGAAFGRGPARPVTAAMSARAPSLVAPFALARVLAASPPDVVVIDLDDAQHPLRGAVPASAYGRDDAALVAHAPTAGRIILAARDPVRADRVARRLLAAGHSVQVLAGGLDAWDAAMRADPPPPADNASADARARYAFDVALRHAFGDPGAAPVAPVRAVAPPPSAPSAGSGRREGC